MDYNNIVNDLFKNLNYSVKKEEFSGSGSGSGSDSDTNSGDIYANSLQMDIKYNKKIVDRQSIYDRGQTKTEDKNSGKYSSGGGGEEDISAGGGRGEEDISAGGGRGEEDSSSGEEEDSSAGEDSNFKYSYDLADDTDDDVSIESLTNYSNSLTLKNIKDFSLDKNPLDHLHKKPNNLNINLFDKEVIEKDYYVIIENSNKNNSGDYEIIDPSGYNQTIELNQTFKNVIKADLIEAIIKQMPGNSYESDPSGTPFIMVEVDEFKGNYISNNDNIARSFKTLAYYLELNTGNRFKHYTDLDNRNAIVFNPRKTITGLTIRFKKPDGTDFLFSGSSISERVYWLTFRITCLERKLKTSI